MQYLLTVNFQDSKEIMMTSDSENDFKISSTSRDFLTTAHVSPCPEGELRCVSGICISISQLCDRVIRLWMCKFCTMIDVLISVYAGH